MNIDLIIAKIYGKIASNFASCNNLKNSDCRWFSVEMTAVRGNSEYTEYTEFIPFYTGDL